MYDKLSIEIRHGDNLELLKQYPNNHFDSIVTDPPYGLGDEPDPVKLFQDWIDHGYHEIKGKGFMGKEWDAFVPQPIIWKEMLRVLKPGGYLLSFAGTRTYDWVVMGLRFAGFEIRDMICWHYGSGFPKSLDISKQLDKMAGAEREKVNNPKAKQQTAQNAGKGLVGSKSSVDYIYPNASTDEAKQADGWGTALKPATEPICVARKPIEGTVAGNYLKYGTGGINIDGCRIEFQSEDDLKSATFGTGTNIIGANYVGSKLTDGRKDIEANPKGRFPANVILDPFMAAELDRQTGVLTSGKPNGKVNIGNRNVYGFSSNIGTPITGYGDSGGASRFFYCAKASQDERNAGCEHLGLTTTTDGRIKPIDNAFNRGETERNNFHPTVKPISLIRYLHRLVTPKGGLTLDPYAGSGTAGCAASFEELNIVLMERDETYMPIIEARTSYWQKVANRERYIQQLKYSQQTLF